SKRRRSAGLALDARKRSLPGLFDRDVASDDGRSAERRGKFRKAVLASLGVDQDELVAAAEEHARHLSTERAGRARYESHFGKSRYAIHHGRHLPHAASPRSSSSSTRSLPRA